MTIERLNSKFTFDESCVVFIKYSANGCSLQSHASGLSRNDKFFKVVVEVIAFLSMIEISFPSNLSSFSCGSGAMMSEVKAL